MLRGRFIQDVRLSIVSYEFCQNSHRSHLSHDKGLENCANPDKKVSID